MGHSMNLIILFTAFLLCIIPCITSKPTSFRPKGLILPVTKDPSTLQYVTHLKQRTPLVPIKLTLDLGGQYLWVDCENAYVSSTYKPTRCNSAPCSLANSKSCGDCFSPAKPGCNNNTCGVLPENTVERMGTSGELAQDVVSLRSTTTNGMNPGRVVSVPKYIFTCGTTFLLKGLAKGVKGMAGLGRTKISLPAQFSAAFSFRRKFAICLSSSSKGVVFFGDGPYKLLPLTTDLSESLTYTPLILNPVSTASVHFAGDKSSDYFIGVTSIKINDKLVSLNKTLLSINEEGIGGTKISSVNPYTIMETSIYKAFTKTFITQLSKVPRVSSVPPFQTCYDANKFGSTRVGPAVPQIDLVLQSKEVVWRIFGANSMVQVNENVLCLGFIDGGSNPTTSIVIGGYQIEDNLLQFDVATSRLGFSSSLLFQRTTCGNFNFTTNG